MKRFYGNAYVLKNVHKEKNFVDNLGARNDVLAPLNIQCLNNYRFNVINTLNGKHALFSQHDGHVTEWYDVSVYLNDFYIHHT